ncbi:MAG TPA: acyl carrier protein [Candidatus Alectryocaccobium stercorigallinarum]|jgi:acyl carrier protein|nr:acyl carrier protein [Candidatus Alectryocaccobium stercorigallinarum]
MCFDKIKELIVEIISCSEDEVTMETNMKEDLGIDSLDAMELAMSVQDNLGVEIPEDKLAEMVYVKDVVNFVDEHLEK